MGRKALVLAEDEQDEEEEEVALGDESLVGRRTSASWPVAARNARGNDGNVDGETVELDNIVERAKTIVAILKARGDDGNIDGQAVELIIKRAETVVASVG